MYLLLILLPIIGSCFAGLFGRFIGSKGSSLLTSFCLFISFLFSIFLFYEVVLINCYGYIKLATWLNTETLHVDWGLMFDSLTVSMFVIVTFISCLVHIYSIEYMSHDPHLPRFMSYLSLFTFFMLILVSADNFLQMFVGWEGVGLCSYLLINFWFTRIQANKAAIKAMLLNRIGDFSLLIGIFLIFVNFKALDYSTVAALTPFLKNFSIQIFIFNIDTLTIIGVFIFIGAVGKSAQLGLHTWLPDAMEGPTPVSALIHAATMVTAGVFLVIRSSFIFEHIKNILDFITIIGALTSFFAATTGLFQNDLKRVIAYSTCSQLGYMIFACGLSNYSVGFFHLTNHAFFKALLFLSAGSIIHAVSDEQDMRKMGGLKNLIPFTYSVITIGSLALIGFPFFTGFYSKDLVLEIAFSKYNSLGYFSFYIGTIVAYFTAYYSMRLIFLTFLSKPAGYKNVIFFAYDSGFYICFSLSCLVIPSVLAGYYSKEIIVGIGNIIFNAVVYVNVKNFNIFDAEFINTLFKSLPVYFSLFGFFSAFFFYISKFKLLFDLKKSILGKKLYFFLNRKWFIDKIYNEFLGQFFFKFAYSKSYKFIDKGIFEIIGPTGLTKTVSKISVGIDKLQTGYIYHYTSFILITASLFFCFKEIWYVFEFFFDYRLVLIIVVLGFFVNDKWKNI